MTFLLDGVPCVPPEPRVCEKHHSHDKRVSAVCTLNGHACASDPHLLAVFLREALEHRRPW